MSTWKLAGAVVLVAMLVVWTVQSVVMDTPSTSPPVASALVATVDAAARNKDAEMVRRLHRAALVDEKGKVFEDTLASLEAAG